MYYSQEDSQESILTDTLFTSSWDIGSATLDQVHDDLLGSLTGSPSQTSPAFLEPVDQESSAYTRGKRARAECPAPTTSPQLDLVPGSMTSDEHDPKRLCVDSPDPKTSEPNIVLPFGTENAAPLDSDLNAAADKSDSEAQKRKALYKEMQERKYGIKDEMRYSPYSWWQKRYGYLDLDELLAY